jgi:hypothetical protein
MNSALTRIDKRFVPSASVTHISILMKITSKTMGNEKVEQ